jgi:hypothetical protein
MMGIEWRGKARAKDKDNDDDDQDSVNGATHRGLRDRRFGEKWITT